MGTRNLPRHVASRPRSARSLGLLSGSSNYRGETSDRQIVEGREGGRGRGEGREEEGGRKEGRAGEEGRRLLCGR